MKRLIILLVFVLSSPASAGEGRVIDWNDIPIPRESPVPPVPPKGDRIVVVPKGPIRQPWPETDYDWKWRDTLPPREYDYLPTMRVVREILPWDALQAVCQSSLYPGPWGACAVSYPEVCIIYWPDRRPPPVGNGWVWAPDDIMLRHEYGHCNGWPGDHPR